MTELVDAVVIGMGPGGEAVANQLLADGLTVVAVESGLIGGECADWGCVPTKMMIRAANLLAEARRIPRMAGTVSVTPDWGPVADRIRQEATHNWNDQLAVAEFTAKGGRFIRGVGRLVKPDESATERLENEGGPSSQTDPDSCPIPNVEVGSELFSPRIGVVIATGARNLVPPIPGLAEVPFWTNREAVSVAQLPTSLAIIGGGAIAVELGQVFARFGVEVTIVEVADRLLSFEEPEASIMIESVLRAEGVSVLTGVEVRRVSHANGIFDLDLGSVGSVKSEQLLVAAGRRPDLTSLGVEAIGVDPLATSLSSDGHLRAAPHVWAVGDVTGVGAFTHVATYQAGIAAADILGNAHETASYRAIPRVAFTDPEIGSVGLSESAARAQRLRIRVGTAPTPLEARGWIHKVGNEGLVKLVEDSERGVLVGALSAGPAGGEVLGQLTLAVHAEVPTSQLRTMIHAYPTFHRAILAALDDLHE